MQHGASGPAINTDSAAAVQELDAAVMALPAQKRRRAHGAAPRRG